MDECELVMKKLFLIEALSKMSDDGALTMRTLMRMNLRNILSDHKEVWVWSALVMVENSRYSTPV